MSTRPTKMDNEVEASKDAEAIPMATLNRDDGSETSSGEDARAAGVSKVEAFNKVLYQSGTSLRSHCCVSLPAPLRSITNVVQAERARSSCGHSPCRSA